MPSECQTASCSAKSKRRRSGPMTGKSKKTYEVGYKKPPVATRFKKGQSPNPGGRPKKVRALRDPGAILEAVDNEEIIVTDNGKRKRMKKAEIQLFSPGICWSGLIEKRSGLEAQ